jgi:hypothetical protein
MSGITGGKPLGTADDPREGFVPDVAVGSKILTWIFEIYRAERCAAYCALPFWDQRMESE